MKVRLVKKQPISGNITSFYFEPEAPLRYVAGQYIELFIPHSNPDKRKEHRWFTLSSSPTEDLLTITTRLITPKKSSFKNALNKLNIGDEIKMLPPMGDFVLPKDESLPLIFVAKGIGVTPFRSMLKYLNDTHKKRSIKVIYAVNDASDAIFKDIIKPASSEFTVHIGNLGSKELLDYSGEIKDEVIFMAGPEKMVESLQNDLLRQGVNPAQIRTDFFHNYD